MCLSAEAADGPTHFSTVDDDNDDVWMTRKRSSIAPNAASLPFIFALAKRQKLEGGGAYKVLIEKQWNEAEQTEVAPRATILATWAT